MKKILFTTSLLAFGLVGSAIASVPEAAVSRAKLKVHGILVTRDATCRTGFSAYTPKSQSQVLANTFSSAQEIDFKTGPSLGGVDGLNQAGCMVVLVQNQIDLTWLPGSFAATGEDASCNSGGTKTVSLCGSSTATVSWSSELGLMASKAGNLATSCATAGATDILPIYYSTFSTCNLGSSNAACADVNPFSYPTALSSASNGVRFTTSSVALNEKYRKIEIDPSGLLSGSGGSCNRSASLFKASTVSAPVLAQVAPVTAAVQNATTSTVSTNSSAAAAPTITAVSLLSGLTPNAGPTTGGTGLVVYGTNFSEFPTVFVGSTLCSNVAVNTARTQITCTTAAGSAAVSNLVVQNSDAQEATSYSAFEFRARPVITSISPTYMFRANYFETADPSTLMAAAYITITGSGFRVASSLGAQSGTAYRVSISVREFSSASNEFGMLPNQGLTCRNPIINSTGTEITCYPNMFRNEEAYYQGRSPLASNIAEDPTGVGYGYGGGLYAATIYVTNYPDTEGANSYDSGVTGTVSYSPGQAIDHITPVKGFNFHRSTSNLQYWNY